MLKTRRASKPPLGPGGWRDSNQITAKQDVKKKMKMDWVSAVYCYNIVIVIEISTIYIYMYIVHVLYNDDMELTKSSTMTIIELAIGVVHEPDRIWNPQLTQPS